MTLHRVDGRGEERARLDDQNTLKGDHNKVTRTAPLLLSRVRVSHGLYPGWVSHGFHFLYKGYRHPTLSLSTSWAPLGSHMVSRDGRGYTPRGSRGKVSTIVDLPQEDISVRRVSTSKELTCNKQ